MINPIQNIIGKIVRLPEDTINILTCVSHERFEPTLALVPNTYFWSLEKKNQTRSWKIEYSPIPENYTIISEDSIPPYINIDLMISHNPFVHIPIMNCIRGGNTIPIINVMHTMPSPGWCPDYIKQTQPLMDLCSHTVYISDFNRLSWGYNHPSTVIYHGIDNNLFLFSDVERKPIVITVANDFIGRNWALGFSLWEEIVKNVLHKAIGDTPNYSKPASNLQELLSYYQQSLIYLNTSLYSPIPMSLLEAASTGCAIVSTNTCAIPEFFTHTKDAFLFSPSHPEKAIQYIKHLLTHPDEAVEMGKRARQAIIDKCEISRFVSQWEGIIEEVVNG